MEEVASWAFWEGPELRSSGVFWARLEPLRSWSCSLEAILSLSGSCCCYLLVSSMFLVLGYLIWMVLSRFNPQVTLW